MTRPPCRRRIHGSPDVVLFKPAGIPSRELEVVEMTLDEYEAVRLADLEGLYHQEAAERMEVSRATFGRILDSAHLKLARVLVGGRALSIEGGPVRIARMERPVGGRGARCRKRARRSRGQAAAPQGAPAREPQSPP